MTRIGDIVDGKYRVLDLIGEGGMASVWLVRDSRLNKEWAVKEIRKNGRDENNELVTQTLITEANLMKEFDHPALPRVVDIIEDDSSIYVVMDRVEGKSLKEVMAERGQAFDYKDVVEWGKTLCDVLEYLHTLNPPVIYRDMKPDNIMLRDDNAVKLIDFGVAKKYKEYKTSDTVVGGTKGYAAPEQFSGNRFSTVRSDVYGLGATLHHLVTGRAPWEDTFKRPIRQINAKLPEGLEYIISKATNEDPDKRYASCAEMRYDLDRYQNLTAEFRAGQEEKVRHYNQLRLAALICLLLGFACLGLSVFFKNSTYDSLMAEAQAADSSEIAGAESAAETLYAQAIEVEPSSIEPYQRLVEIYKGNDTIGSDGSNGGSNNFSMTEAARWAQVFNAHRGSIESSDDYAQLCYDVGLLYFVYFENDSQSSNISEDNREYAVSGGIQAAQWFDRAIQSYDDKGGSSSLSKTDRDAASVYKTIGEFYDRLSSAMFEGNEGGVYEGYWDALTSAVQIVSGEDGADASEGSTPTIVQLRLYEIVYEALGSPTYLTGFKRAGVSEEQAQSLYHDVMDLFAFGASDKGAAKVDKVTLAQSEALYNDAQANARTAAIYEEISSHRSDVSTNIATVYGNGISYVQEDTDGESGVDR